MIKESQKEITCLGLIFFIYLIFFDISEKIPLNVCYYVREASGRFDNENLPWGGSRGVGGSIFYPISLKFGMYM